MKVPQRVVERALSNVAPQEGGCILSLYSIGSHGYAQIGWSESGKTTMVLVHRVAYEALIGPIPSDLTVDHICRTRNCLNPKHLRLLTNFDNARDNGMVGTNPTVDRVCKKHGEQMVGSANSKTPEIYCRSCKADRSRRYRQRKKAPPGSTPQIGEPHGRHRV